MQCPGVTVGIVEVRVADAPAHVGDLGDLDPIAEEHLVDGGKVIHH